MIPLGSVGGCHSKVMEEAVTFAKVTFCGGSNGSESQAAQTQRTHMNIQEVRTTSYKFMVKKYFG